MAKKLCAFGVEELRAMIDRGKWLDDAMELAARELEADPLVAGDFFRGDLLKSFLTVSPTFWRKPKNRGLEARAVEIVRRVRKHIAEHPYEEKWSYDGYVDPDPRAPTPSAREAIERAIVVFEARRVGSRKRRRP